MTQPADTIYKNGAIYTVDEANPWAQAVAIHAGKFVYVGNNEGVEAFSGPNTIHHNLAGKMVLPGLHDMHIHGVEGALAQLYHCNFPLTASATDIVSAVATFANERPDEAWIVGGAWLMGIVADIDKAKLDAVCADRPIFLWDAAHHNAWVNSKALALAGIDATTPDPTGGEIVRSPSGDATGLLLETAANLVWQSVPERTEAEHETAIIWLADMLNSLGVTSIKEAAVNRPIMRAYNAVNDAGKLNLRVGCHFLWETPFVYDAADMEPLLNDRHQYAGDRVKVDFLKLFLDGVPVAKTACMLEPYAGDAAETHNPYALMLVSRDTLNETLVRFDAEGLIVKMHATGDASLRAALDAIEAARTANGDSGLGHEIAHPQNVHPTDLPRFAQLGAVPDLCPVLWHPSRNWEHSLKPIVGAERAERGWPIGSYHRSGAHIIAGTDWPAMTPDASLWRGIQTLITRADPTGQVSGTLGENEALDLATALKIYSLNGAKAARHDDVCGSIEVGKFADMIVIDQHLFEVSAESIAATQVLLTILEGEVVYNANH